MEKEPAKHSTKRALWSWQPAFSPTMRFRHLGQRQKQYIDQERRQLKEKKRVELLTQKESLQFLEGIEDKKKYRFEEISSATNNFSDENVISKGATGKVYKGKSFTVRRLDCTYGQGEEMYIEISTLKRLRHENISSISGYCNENNERIIIYTGEFTTLDQHLSDRNLELAQRIKICLSVAHALHYIHHDHDVIHCDINSSKIFLDKDWKPKIYGFELSIEYPQSWMRRLHSSRFDTNKLKCDVYSFGVLLLEVLCGRKPKITNDGVEEELDEIIGDPSYRKEMGIESLRRFKDLAYKCMNQQFVQRPTMDQIVKVLEEVSDLLRRHANPEHSKAAAGTSSNKVKMEFLEIPLSEIRQATNDFNQACFVGSGGFADVYRAELDVLDTKRLSTMRRKSKQELPKVRKTVAIKRITNKQGKEGFFTEIELLTTCKHPNIVPLLGFSRENDELILVYEFALNGSLGDYLGSNGKEVNLTWSQRLQICLDAAKGIDYLHTNIEGKPRIIHRDIKSDNILLDKNLKAMIADFGLSKTHPINQQASTIITKNIAGTDFYIDPEYWSTLKYKRETDIYSFGVVLFEVLSGRFAYDSTYTSENRMGLAPIARRRFNEGTLKELIDPKLIEEDGDHIFTLNKGPTKRSLRTFSKVAYRCLAETQAKRPTMEVVINKLQKALKLQGDTVVLLRFLLHDIVLATENFAERNCIGLDKNGMVYKAELDHFGNNSSLASVMKNDGESSKKSVAIKRITSRKGWQRTQGFFAELEMRACKHPNVVSLIGFCVEGDEMILVYEHASAATTLDDYLKSVNNMDNFTWTQRLHMCLEIARGLNQLHTNMVNLQRTKLLNDIRSANILVDKNRGVKIAYSVISKLHLPNQTEVMKVYEDPVLERTGKLKREYDIYSFGVLLLEILCGRVAYDQVYMKEDDKGLAPIARRFIEDGNIQRIIDPRLKDELGEDIGTSFEGPNDYSMHTFLMTAYHCVGEPIQRPSMEKVIEELEGALNSLC